MNTDDFYMALLNGRSVLIDGWYGFSTDADREYIRVQGAGSWAHKIEDKTSFIDDFNKLTERYAGGDINNWVIK